MTDRIDFRSLLTSSSGGEGDLRACYIAMAVAHMLCLDVEELVQRSGLVEYVKSCQVGGASSFDLDLFVLNIALALDRIRRTREAWVGSRGTKRTVATLSAAWLRWLCAGEPRSWTFHDWSGALLRTGDASSRNGHSISAESPSPRAPHCSLCQSVSLMHQLASLSPPLFRPSVSWAAQRQGTVEGGFNGRTNKLVDGCYRYPLVISLS